MSDDTIKLGGFGSLAKKLKENNVNVNEEELSSLFNEALSDSKDGKISASDFSNALSKTYGIKDDKDILNVISQIASNDGKNEDLTIEDFEIQDKTESNQYINDLSFDDKAIICEKLQAQAQNLMTQLNQTSNNQGWLSKGLSKINNIFGFGTSEKEAKAKIEEYQKLISELDPNDSDFMDKYEKITGEKLSEESIAAFLFDSDSYIEEYKKQYEAQYGTSLSEEQTTALKDYIENESNINRLGNLSEVIYDYENTQSTAKEITVGILTGLTSAASIVAAPFTGGLSLGIGALVGGATKTTLEGTDSIGSDHKYTLEEGILDFASGALDGSITALTLGGANLAGKGFKAIFNSTSKTLIKNQTISNAKNLVQSGGKTMLKQAYSNFAKSAIRAVGISEISTVGRYAIDTVGKSALYDITENYTVSNNPSQIIQNEDGTYSIYYAVSDSNNGENLFYQIETVDNYTQDENGNYIKGNVLSTSRTNDFNVLDLGKQMATSAAAAGAGALIGRFTNNMVNPTITALSNSTAIGNISEMAADGVLSLGADYLMASIQQGELVDSSEFFSWDRILGEGRNQIRSLLIGVASSKANASTNIIEQEASKMIQDGNEEAARKFLQDNGYKEKNIDSLIENANKLSTPDNTFGSRLKDDEANKLETLIKDVIQEESSEQADVLYMVLKDAKDRGCLYSDNYTKTIIQKYLELDEVQIKNFNDLFISKGVNLEDAIKYSAQDEYSKLNQILSDENSLAAKFITSGADVKQAQNISSRIAIMNDKYFKFSEDDVNAFLEECSSLGSYNIKITGGLYKGGYQLTATRSTLDSDYNTIISFETSLHNGEVQTSRTQRNAPKIEVKDNKIVINGMETDIKYEAGMELKVGVGADGNWSINGTTIKGEFDNNKLPSSGLREDYDYSVSTRYRAGNKNVELDYNQETISGGHDLKSQIEVVNDADGNPSYIISTMPSKELKGAYDITRYNLADYSQDIDVLTAIKQGTITGGEKLASAKTNPDGSVEYNQTYDFNGFNTKRNYIQQTDEEGRIVSSNYKYNITSEDGKTLLNIERSWTKNSDNTTTTVVNGKTYTSSFDDDNLIITVEDSLGNQQVIDIKAKLDLGNNSNQDYLKYFEFLKTIPADELIELGKNSNKINIVDMYRSSYSSRKYISSSESASELYHELGHSRGFNYKDDSGMLLYKNKEYEEIFYKEWNKLKEEYPSAAQEIINYFGANSDGNSCCDEMFAEINMLLTTYGHDNNLSGRAAILAKYFPETIAKIAQLSGYEVSLVNTGDVYKLKSENFDKTGIIDILRSKTDYQIQGEKINKDDIDLEFLNKIGSLGQISDDGKITVNLSNGKTAQITANIEEINGQKVIHTYNLNGNYIASFYNNGIVSSKDFTQYLLQQDEGVVYGRKFTPNSSSTEDIKAFYVKHIQDVLNENGEINLQDAIDMFPIAKQVNEITAKLSTGETNYSISDGCSFSFVDADGAKWQIRVHSQDLTSSKKNWIFRVGYTSGKETKYFDLNTKTFSGEAKGENSESSHLPVAPFYKDDQEILNDGNFISYIAHLSSKLNCSSKYTMGIIGRIRSFAKTLGIENPKSFGKGDIGADKLIEALINKGNYKNEEEMLEDCLKMK